MLDLALEQTFHLGSLLEQLGGGGTDLPGRELAVLLTGDHVYRGPV